MFSFLGTIASLAVSYWFIFLFCYFLLSAVHSLHFCFSLSLIYTWLTATSTLPYSIFLILRDKNINVRFIVMCISLSFFFSNSSPITHKLDQTQSCENINPNSMKALYCSLPLSKHCAVKHAAVATPSHAAWLQTLTGRTHPALLFNQHRLSFLSSFALDRAQPLNRCFREVLTCTGVKTVKIAPR